MLSIKIVKIGSNPPSNQSKNKMVLLLYIEEMKSQYGKEGLNVKKANPEWYNEVENFVKNTIENTKNYVKTY